MTRSPLFVRREMNWGDDALLRHTREIAKRLHKCLDKPFSIISLVRSKRPQSMLPRMSINMPLRIPYYYPRAIETKTKPPGYQ